MSTFIVALLFFICAFAGIRLLTIYSRSFHSVRLRTTTSLPIRHSRSSLMLKAHLDAHLESCHFTSVVRSISFDYKILTPPSHDRALNGLIRYPILYWLHGSKGGQASLFPLASRFFQGMQDGDIPEMYVIFPESKPLSMWVDSNDGSYPIETAFVNEFIPMLCNLLLPSNKRDEHFIAGFSMGGYGAARIALKYPDQFGHLLMFGAGPLDEDLEDTPRANSFARESVLQDVYGGDQKEFYTNSPRYIAQMNLDLLKQKRLSISIFAGLEDKVFQQNKRFSAFLSELGIGHLFIPLHNISHDLKSYIMTAGIQVFSSAVTLTRDEMVAESRLLGKN